MCGNPLEVLSPVVGIFGAAGRQRKALKAQERAQAAALVASQKTAADAAKAEANVRRAPNYEAMFGKSTIAPGSTVLTGAGGVTNGLTLARNSLLGS